MRKNISFIVAAFAALFLSARASACGCTTDPQNKWQDKMRSEMIAFLTAETGITPAEAEKFWPVYNEAEKARRKAFKKVMEAYNAMEEAVKGNMSAKELEKRIEAYVEAQEEAHEVDGEYVDKYLRILPAEKVARLLVAEEKFRRNQINRLHERGGAGLPNESPRPGKRSPAEE